MRRSKLLKPCVMAGAFPAGSLQDYFLSPEEGRYSLDVDLNEIHRHLLSMKLEGNYSVYKFYSLLRAELKKFGLITKKKYTHMSPSVLPNGICFGGYWDYVDIAIVLYLPLDFNQKIKIDSDSWKLYSYQIVRTIAHEAVHVIQSSLDMEDDDIYNYHVIPRKVTLKKAFRDEINYVFEPAEIEAMTFEAVLDEYNSGVPAELSDALFQINRGIENLDKYYQEDDAKDILRQNLAVSLEFWKNFLWQKLNLHSNAATHSK